jgi:hypothetical protein
MRDCLQEKCAVSKLVMKSAFQITNSFKMHFHISNTQAGTRRHCVQKAFRTGNITREYFKPAQQSESTTNTTALKNKKLLYLKYNPFCCNTKSSKSGVFNIYLFKGRILMAERFAGCIHILQSKVCILLQDMPTNISIYIHTYIG